MKYFSEDYILKGCQKGERKAQEMLYHQYAKKMYNVCLGYAYDEELAKDLLQEGFVKVFKNINNFKNSGSLEGWIRKIMVNNAIDYFRSNKKNRRFTDFNEESFNDENYVISNEGVENLYQQDFLNLIKNLPEKYRIILNLYFLEGYNHKEIAERLDINIGTSKSQLFKAKKFLKKRLSAVPEMQEFSMAI